MGREHREGKEMIRLNIATLFFLQAYFFQGGISLIQAHKNWGIFLNAGTVPEYSSPFSEQILDQMKYHGLYREECPLYPVGI